MRKQAADARNMIPGSRTAQAQDQREYYEITPGVRGAGTRSGPRPDQGSGYPEAKGPATSGSMWRMAMPRTSQGTGGPGAKR